MKILVTKMEAAKSQLTTAIQLFFEEADPVSVHTLTAASLQILHDHFTDVGKVYDSNLIFHYDTIYIKDQYRKEWADKMRDAQNFFKHADRDLKAGRTEIEFNTEATAFHILEALNCVQILESSNLKTISEFQVFWGWFVLKYPDLINDKYKQATAKVFENGPNPSDLGQFRKVIEILKGLSFSEALNFPTKRKS